MSFSWTREGRERGQASPLAALVALFAVCTGVSIYVVALGGTAALGDDRTYADPTLHRVSEELADGGVADPSALGTAQSAAPDGRRLNVTLTAGDRRWTAGPTPPNGTPTDAASRTTSVRFGPGSVVPGRLRVAVWR
ncbi:DUF7285 family protein [Halopelagius longus]|uniref:Uncharacterized protein n=1 Tax=Halopelagius longus TaxID=1236180 RepID=A0A1H1D9C7_9EURY|nr:hypothetical protein [Halopelagius longus]RDI71230.1 hypothetical protein DWB78_05485 [Halopelagius longus]SDQ73020.1 hypothetical protein SAMN05216278_2294 [Halopelagius longus]